MRTLTELIARASWRELKTYRHTWPHDYLLTKKRTHQELLDAFCERVRNGEGIEGRFLSWEFTYLFIGQYKYWSCNPCMEIGLQSSGSDFALNGARLYMDRRDSIVKPGDKGV